MNIFPHVLVRMGGGSFDHLAKLTVDELAPLGEQLTALRSQKEALKVRLSELLLECIRQLEDSKAQNAVQNARRDLFNGRPVKPAALEQVRQLLTDPVRQELDAYLIFLVRIQEVSEQFNQVYAYAVVQTRQYLQDLSRDENLQKGLILSSQTLLESMATYQQKDPASFRKRELQTEYSVLKYLTRMYAKTSPFSTFNNLALGELRSGAAFPLDWEPCPDQDQLVRGHIRLNNHLFQYLNALFSASREIYLRLLVRPSPTVSRQDNHFWYLTNHHNAEAFQRIPANSVVTLLLELCGRTKTGIRFNNLITQAQEFVDASPDALENYVKQLVEYGLLEYDLGVSGIDPDWDVKLVEHLRPLVEENVAHLPELVHTLRFVRLLAQQYTEAAVQERVALLKEAYQALRGVCMRLHEAAGLPADERKEREEFIAEQQKKYQEQPKPEEATDKPAAFRHQSFTFFAFKPEQLFYEDSTRAIRACLDADAVREFVRQLDALWQQMGLFRGNADEKDQMRHFFLTQYGPDAAVDLLTYYEAYYRNVKKPESERLALQQKETAEPLTPAGNPLAIDEQQTADLEKSARQAAIPVPGIQQRQERVRKWNALYTKAIAPLLVAEEAPIHLRLEAVQQTNLTLSEPSTLSAPTSYGIFVQFFQEPDEQGILQLKGVLNASSPGYGKMISRFLHIFHGRVTQDVRRWNESLMDEKSIFLEDCDASYFNANLHPPLMPYEIRTPGGHNSLATENQLPVTDFEVRYDEQQQQLQLIHTASAKQAYVFDLGFEGHRRRSQLFQLLEKFTKAEYVHPFALVDAANKAIRGIHQGREAEKPEGTGSSLPRVTVYPRVVYQDQIILQRKSWHVPKELIPTRQPQESDADYFVAVQAWRNQLGMMDEVFIYANPTRGSYNGIQAKQFQKLGRDDYKPQYIHFGNPLLVTLFERLVAKVPTFLRVEEMLPNSAQLATIDGAKFVTEYVVQWYQSEA